MQGNARTIGMASQDRVCSLINDSDIQLELRQLRCQQEAS